MQWLESGLTEKEPGDDAQQQVNTNKLCRGGQEDQEHLAFISNLYQGGSRNRAKAFPPCWTFLRSHLEFCVQFWVPHDNKDAEELEPVQ